MFSSRSPAPEGGSGTPDAAGAAAYFAGEWIAELPTALPRELAALIPARTARALGVIPWAERAGELVVVCVDPLRADLAEDLGFALGRPVRLAAAEPMQVRRLLAATYPITGDASAAGRLGKSGEEMLAGRSFDGREFVGDSRKPVRSEADELLAQAAAGPVVEFVGGVLQRAVEARAADVHFETWPEGLRVRCRIDGTLREVAAGPPALALAAASRLKVLAGLDVAERRRPQDGRLRWSQGSRAVDLRVSTLPTQGGESVVLRVLDPANAARGIETLELPAGIRSDLERTLALPGGLVVVTGPTGSGKTTTLHACLRKLNTPATKVLTAEDPVEYEIEGITQVAVQPAIGLTFATALRSFLRQDPDVILVGEIRDNETAEIAVQAALTGHLVLATLHTIDAAGAVARLVDLGLEPYRVAAALQGVLAQRLVRKLCSECRVRVVPTAAELAQFGAAAGADGRCTEFTLREPAGAESPEWFAARGCDVCGGTGFRGRRAIFEWLPIDEALRDAIGSGRPREDWPGARRESLRAAAIVAMRQGWTSWDEALRHT